MCASLTRLEFGSDCVRGDVCVSLPPIATVAPWKTSPVFSIRKLPAVEGHGVAIVGTGSGGFTQVT